MGCRRAPLLEGSLVVSGKLGKSDFNLVSVRYDSCLESRLAPFGREMTMPTSQNETKLLELIHAKTGVLPQMDDTFDVLKIDSLAMAELTSEIEKAFSIRIGEDITHVSTIRELIEYVERKSSSARPT
jgi:acyl carrier protein